MEKLTTNNVFWLITKRRNAYLVSGFKVETDHAGEFVLFIHLPTGVIVKSKCDSDTQEKIYNFITDPKRGPDDKLIL